METKSSIRTMIVLVAFMCCVGCVNLGSPDSFDRIKLGMHEYDLNKAFAGQYFTPDFESREDDTVIRRDPKYVVGYIEGKEFTPIGWPRNIEELPENEAGYFRGEIRWVCWQVKDKHRWVALGFGCSSISLSAPEVVIKKSGLNGPEWPPGFRCSANLDEQATAGAIRQ